MDAEDHARACKLFHEACELPEDERKRFLDRACGDASELRAEVEALLKHDDPSSSFPSAGATFENGVGAPSDSPPDRVGPYRILRLLGEGGMGTVYLALQEAPIRREVALKLIKPGLETKAVLTRFDTERQALALMDHPNVARVFDAGTTEHGRPYFAMEFVRGEPITSYCDRLRLTTGQRLELFMLVCDGIQHAHQKGIIHRDVKPSNVLVGIQDDKAVPKIIDFGVAKATQQRLTEKTAFTAMGVLIGTPEYMSPEQAEMTTLDVDTRSDVYSLGVLLYELLVGALPFDPKELRAAGFEEIRRRIREEEPSRPSARLNTLDETAATGSARKRRTDRGALARQLRGDLDWITMKALDKDRTRRYGSPSELAEDLRRHLRHEPVIAGPPSAAYRARKFVQRNRVGVAFAAVLALLLIGFGVRERIQSNRVARERDRASQEAETAKQVSKFLAGLFGASDPYEAQGDESTAREILDRGAERIESELGDQPEVKARLMLVMGDVYRRLGLFEQARPLLEGATTTLRELLGVDHPATLDGMASLTILYRELARYDEAEKLGRETLDARIRILGPDHRDTLRSRGQLGWILRFQVGSFDEAEQLLQQSAEDHRRVLGHDHPDTASALNDLVWVYARQRRFDEAEALEREVHEIQLATLGPDHPDTITTVDNLGLLARDQGRYEEAESLFLKALEDRRRVFGNVHGRTAESLRNLGYNYLAQERFDEADEAFQQMLEISRELYGQEHENTFLALHSLADVQRRRGNLEQAEKQFSDLLDRARSALGPDHSLTIYYLVSLGRIHKRQGRLDDAEKGLRQALEAYRRTGDDYGNTERMVGELGDIYNAMGASDKARPLVVESIGYLRRDAEAPNSTAKAKNAFAWFLLTCEPEDLRDPSTAVRFARVASELTDHRDPGILDTLALAYHLTDDTIRAIETEKHALALLAGDDADSRAEFERRIAEYEAALENQ